LPPSSRPPPPPSPPLPPAPPPHSRQPVCPAGRGCRQQGGCCGSQEAPEGRRDQGELQPLQPGAWLSRIPRTQPPTRAAAAAAPPHFAGQSAAHQPQLRTPASIWPRPHVSSKPRALSTAAMVAASTAQDVLQRAAQNDLQQGGMGDATVAQAWHQCGTNVAAHTLAGDLCARSASCSITEDALTCTWHANACRLGRSLHPATWHRTLRTARPSSSRWRQRSQPTA